MRQIETNDFTGFAERRIGTTQGSAKEVVDVCVSSEEHFRLRRACSGARLAVYAERQPSRMSIAAGFFGDPRKLRGVGWMRQAVHA
jgi:hypothetical protein